MLGPLVFKATCYGDLSSQCGYPVPGHSVWGLLLSFLCACGIPPSLPPMDSLSWVSFRSSLFLPFLPFSIWPLFCLAVESSPKLWIVWLFALMWVLLGDPWDKVSLGSSCSTIFVTLVSCVFYLFVEVLIEFIPFSQGFGEHLYDNYLKIYQVYYLPLNHYSLFLRFCPIPLPGTYFSVLSLYLIFVLVSKLAAVFCLEGMALCKWWFLSFTLALVLGYVLNFCGGLNCLIYYWYAPIFECVQDLSMIQKGGISFST